MRIIDGTQQGVDYEMIEATRQDLESALCREWPRLRELDCLQSVLPSCRTRQWVRDDGIVGYVTLDYQLHADLKIPGAWNQPRVAVASLVEHYWSVRTRDRRQDSEWLPSLNLNVVNIRNTTVTSDDAEEVLRYALVLERAARSAGRSWLAQDKRANLYVRAVLLGAEIGPDVNLLAAMDTLRL